MCCVLTVLSSLAVPLSTHDGKIFMLAQEYIGTMGADYIQYLVTDKVTSPERLQHIYSEKVQ